MARYAQRYVLIRRHTRHRTVYYYRLRGEQTAHSTGASNREAARQYVEKRLEDLGAPKTLREYAAPFFRWGSCEWIERQHAKGHRFSRIQARNRRSHLDLHILPALGDIALEELNPVRIETWLARLPLASQSQNHILSTLSIVLREARRERVLTLDPLEHVERMAVVYRRRDALTMDDIKALFPADRGELLAVWDQLRFAVAHYLMLTTGMRTGECIALRWEHIVWDVPAVLILRAYKAEGAIGRPKNEDERAALLPKRTVAMLQAWRAETPCALPADFVIHGQSGGRTCPSSLQRAWLQAVARSGIPTAGRFLGAHALRHTYETRIRGLLPDEVIRYMLGHKSAAMTERYDQATPEQRVRRLTGWQGPLEEGW